MAADRMDEMAGEDAQMRRCGMAKGDRRGDASVECPYYVNCKGKSVICKGGLDVKGKTETVFRTEAKRREYMGHFCQRYYSLCPMVQANDKILGFDRPEVRDINTRNE